MVKPIHMSLVVLLCCLYSYDITNKQPTCIVYAHVDCLLLFVLLSSLCLVAMSTLHLLHELRSAAGAQCADAGWEGIGTGDLRGQKHRPSSPSTRETHFENRTVDGQNLHKRVVLSLALWPWPFGNETPASIAFRPTERGQAKHPAWASYMSTVYPYLPHPCLE